MLPLLTAALLLAGPTPSGRTSTSDRRAESPRVVTVLGEGTAVGRPDTAQVQLGVEIVAKDLTTAQRQANERMDRVLSVLRRAGVSDRDLRTVRFSVDLERAPEPRPAGPIVGYRVVHLVEVRFRNLDAVGPALDQAIAAGANSVGGIAFTVGEPAPLEAKARAQAVASARREAEQLAQSAGVRLGPVLEISEPEAQPLPPIPMRAALTAEAAVPVQPGTIEFHQTVRMVFALD